MPLYTIATQTGVLGDKDKAALAGQLTQTHCKFSGVPENWVHIVFQDYPAGNGFTAGKPAATAALTLLIRTGRSPEYKRELLTSLWRLLQNATGARTIRSSSAFRKCRRAKRWRWVRSCQMSWNAEGRRDDCVGKWLSKTSLDHSELTKGKPLCFETVFCRPCADRTVRVQANG